MHGGAEEPGRSQCLVERDHRCLVGSHVQQVGEGLGEIVRLDRAARHVDDRDAGLRLPAPAEIVRNPHGAGRVAGHGVDTAVRRAGPGSDDGRGLRSESIQPFGRRDRLAGGRVVAEAAPVTLVLDLLVRDRALDHQDERFEFATIRLAEPLEEVVLTTLWPALEIDQRPVHSDLREPGQRTKGDLLDARLGRSGQRDRVPVATETGIDPQHMDQRFFCLEGGGRRHRSHPFPRLDLR